MHLVHYKTAYGSLTSALSHADGVAVVGIMFQADHNNHNYEPLKVKIIQRKFTEKKVKYQSYLVWHKHFGLCPSAIVSIFRTH